METLAALDTSTTRIRATGRIRPKSCTHCDAKATPEMVAAFGNAASRTGTTTAALLDAYLTRFHNNGHR